MIIYANNIKRLRGRPRKPRKEKPVLVKKVCQTKSRVAELYSEGMAPPEIVKVLGVTRAMVNFYLNELDTYEPNREGKARRAEKEALAVKEIADILNISTDDAKLVYETDLSKSDIRILARLNKIDIAIQDHKPETVNELGIILNEKPTAICGFLSRACPDLLRSISRRPSSGEIQERENRIKELAKENPNISIKEIADAIGIKYPTLLVWLMKKPELRKLIQYSNPFGR